MALICGDVRMTIVGAWFGKYGSGVLIKNWKYSHKKAQKAQMSWSPFVLYLARAGLGAAAVD
jgi:hypothetical protein